MRPHAIYRSRWDVRFCEEGEDRQRGPPHAAQAIADLWGNPALADPAVIHAFGFVDLDCASGGGPKSPNAKMAFVTFYDMTFVSA